MSIASVFVLVGLVIVIMYFLNTLRNHSKEYRDSWEENQRKLNEDKKT